MYILQMHFPASNNAAEYEALLHGLRITTSLDIQRLKVLGDLMLVINQANKEWSCLDKKMMTYCQELRKLGNNFNRLEYYHVLHGRIEVADELAKLNSSRGTMPLGVFMQELHEPSISQTLSKAIKATESIDSTTTPADDKSDSSDIMMVQRMLFMIYIKTGGLLKNKNERERLRRRAGHYTLIGEELFW
jgi:hypothetical protein